MAGDMACATGRVRHPSATVAAAGCREDRPQAARRRLRLPAAGARTGVIAGVDLRLFPWLEMVAHPEKEGSGVEGFQ